MHIFHEGYRPIHPIQPYNNPVLRFEVPCDATSRRPRAKPHVAAR